MKALFKLFLFLITLTVVVIIGAAIAVPMYFDPNDHKDKIADYVKEKTGRELKIAGDIGLSVFPWLGVDLGAVELGNAPGFGDRPFASAGKLQVRVKLLPLLKKQVEVSTVTLHGVNLNLVRDKQGNTNWNDLVTDKGKAKPDKDSADAAPIAALAVGGLDISDANFSWDDQASGSHYAVTGLSLQTGAVTGKDPVDIELDADVSASQPAVSGHIGLRATLDMDIDAQKFSTRGLKLETDLSGDAFPNGKLQASLSGDIALDQAKHTLGVNKLALAVLGLQVSGELQATRLNEEPAFNGTLKVGEFSPRELLAQLGDVPQTTDPGVLALASLQARLSGTANDISLEQLDAVLDDTRASGHARVTGKERKAIRFDLKVDGIDIDRYLPPPAEGEQQAAATPATGAAAGAGALPVATLRDLDMNGKFSIDRLKVAKLSMQSVTMTVSANNGLLTLHPINAKLYDGLYAGKLALDVRGDTPKTSLQEDLTGVQAGPLLKDLTGSDRILGTANVSGDVTALGTSDAEIRRSLNGTARFEFTDGAVNGVNIARMIREAKAKVRGQPLPPDDGLNQTDFSELTGSLNISQGQVRNNDLVAKSPLLRVNGKGNADLVAEKVDYLLSVSVVGTTKGQGGKELDDLKNLTIPIKITGNLTDPSYGLDMGKLLESQAKEKVKEQVEKRLGDQLGDKLPGQLKDGLKGLFGR